MRQWIILFETNLTGFFYHGTARDEDGFRADRPAYFCQSFEDACEHAKMDAEVDGGTARVLKCLLHVSSSAKMDTMLMQDLHLHKHDGLVHDLMSRGFDCAMSDTEGHDEIVVFGNSKIEIIDVTVLK